MSDLAQNKKTVLGFVNLAFNDKQPQDAVAKYLGADYVQHNPQVPDGRDAAAATLTGFIGGFPGLSIDVRRVVAEDDLVVTHSLLKLSPDDRGSAVTDIFRIRHGEIVEHWDVLQEVPETAANDNTMF